MRNLPLPSRAGVQADLEEVLQTYQYGGQTRGYDASPVEIAAIIALYDEYDAGPAIPTNSLQGVGLASALNEAVKAAYKQTHEGRKLEHIRIAAFKNVPKCPICGIDTPTELDHYLPQSDFKPLSIYPRNLVPLCHRCNDDKAATHGAGTEFVHAYFDELPDVQFLAVDISIANGGLVATYSIAEVDGLSAQLHTRLAFQLDELNLDERFGDELTLMMMGHTTALHMAFEAGGAQGIRRYLLKQAGIERGQLYKNHWRPVLLRGLALHADFCDGGFAAVLPVPDNIAGDFLDDLEDA